jgi:hypothetical protein
MIQIKFNLNHEAITLFLFVFLAVFTFGMSEHAN